MSNEMSRPLAISAQLAAVHDWMRAELARIRDSEVPTIDLRARCLAFCGALTEHHTSEDADVFSVLAAEAPHLAPVLDELRADHVVIAEALAQLDEVLHSGRSATQRQLATVAALLETHFTYEERKIAAALDASSVTSIGPVLEG